jgi:uncharacterized membrane protein YozB (DUF420 family)
MSSIEIAQINLALQIFILMVLLTGYLFKRRNRFVPHGTTMLIAVVLNAVSIFLVMGPSLLARIGFIQGSPLGGLSVGILGHAALGSVVELLGVWLVGSWHLQSSTQGCARRRKIMLFTLALWVISILIGILLYTYIYVWAV